MNEEKDYLETLNEAGQAIVSLYDTCGLDYPELWRVRIDALRAIVGTLERKRIL